MYFEDDDFCYISDDDDLDIDDYDSWHSINVDSSFDFWDAMDDDSKAQWFSNDFDEAEFWNLLHDNDEIFDANTAR